MLLILIVGEVGVSERVVVAGIPVNILMCIATFLWILLQNKAEYIFQTFLYLSPLLVGLISFFYVEALEYGLHKFINLFMVSWLVTAAMMCIQDNLHHKDIAKLTVMLFFSILLFALFYKYRNGFFDRSVHFGLNGPNVFSKMMGIALLCSLYAFKRPYKYIIAAVFFLALVWTQSKGPLVALVLTVMYVWYKNTESDQKIFYFLIAAFLSLMFIVNGDSIAALIADNSSNPMLQRYALALDTSNANNAGSIGSRMDAVLLSINMLAEHPLLGVGLGDWGVAAGSDLQYPHNIVLEFLTELGIFVGLIYLLIFLGFLRAIFSPYKVLGLYFLICALFSGDLLDNRYLLICSLLSMHYGNTLYRSEADKEYSA
ncbi:MAG: O-antigen ligase family protein [Pseudomonadales bacterium]|nr:O-antigen ligase family protein [Pseudomonadales bacterium]